MPIRAKLLLIFMLFVVVPIFVYGILVFSAARKAITEVRIAQLNTIADLKKDKIETFFRERTGDLLSAQSFYNIKTNLPSLSKRLRERRDLFSGQDFIDLNRQLIEFQKSHKYLNVILTDTQGKVVYSSNDAEKVHIGKTLPEVDYFNKAKKGIYFSDVFRNKSLTDRLEMIVAGPLHDFNGAFIGEIVLEIDMEPVYQFVFDTIGLGETGEVLIARKEAETVVFSSPLRHDPDAILKRTVPFHSKEAIPAQKAVQGENGSGIVLDYAGVEVLAGWRYIPSLRWGLVTKIETREAFAPITHVRNITILIGLGIVLLAAFAALFIAKTITNPLLRLQKDAEAIAAGDLSHRVGTVAKDEVGQLSRTFDAMTETLVRDIEKRKRALQLLSEKESRLKRSQEIAHLGSWELDIVNNSLTWSDEVYRIFGLQPQEFSATYDAFLDAVHPDDRAAVNDAYAGSLQEGRDSYEIEHRVVRKSTGEIRLVHEKCVHHRDASGRIVRSMGMVHDITERKRAEEEIKSLNDELNHKLTELEAVNKELEAFSYSVSHDLRAPLRGINGFSLALLEDYADKLDQRGKEYLVRVRAGTNKMGALIDALLTLSRMTRVELTRTQVDLSALAHAMANELKKTEPERRAEFSIANGMVAEGDSVMLNVVMQNLFLNAWKFTQKHDAARITFGVTERDGKPVYFVQDNGAGFDAAYAQKLFSAFQRLHTEAEFSGLGIGLATVQRIIHRHGGRVWIEGEVNKGATVFFTL